MITEDNSPPQPFGRRFTRRHLLIGAGTAVGCLTGVSIVQHFRQRAVPVFIAQNQHYDRPLEQTIADGLQAIGVNPAEWTGKTILLKPNLVEPNRGTPHVTTNPAVVVAVAAVFRRAGAQVIVGEGPGHMRDTEMVLAESGMQDALDAAELQFLDINYSETVWVPNVGRASKLKGFYFPRQLIEADLVVSIPKMKTHHWVGYTGAMKNLYGVMPGIKYGWPKNVLHHAGIPETVFDICASVPNTIAVVDGIVSMEGDGPIMGQAKPMGLIVIGANCTAVDATLGRIMGFDPARIGYLQLAANRLGPVEDHAIEQRGERWQRVASPFSIIKQPHLQALQATNA